MKNFIISFLFVLILFFVTIWSQSLSTKISNISLPPVITFEENCSRCHGYEGSAYGKHFGHLKYDSLKSIITDMMIGPAGLNPDSIDIEAMVSYNQSLSRKKPFACVINAKSFLYGKDKGLNIIASPFTCVKVNNSEVKVDSSDDIWLLFYNPEKIKTLKVTIMKNKNSSVLNFPEGLWTK